MTSLIEKYSSFRDFLVTILDLVSMWVAVEMPGHRIGHRAAPAMSGLSFVHRPIIDSEYTCYSILQLLYGLHRVFTSMDACAGLSICGSLFAFWLKLTQQL